MPFQWRPRGEFQGPPPGLHRHRAQLRVDRGPRQSSPRHSRLHGLGGRRHLDRDSAAGRHRHGAHGSVPAALLHRLVEAGPAPGLRCGAGRLSPVVRGGHRRWLGGRVAGAFRAGCLRGRGGCGRGGDPGQERLRGRGLARLPGARPQGSRAAGSLGLGHLGDRVGGVALPLLPVPLR